MSTFFGGTYPAQTWTTFMQGALKGKPVMPFPDFKGTTKSTATPTQDPYNTVGGFEGVDPGSGVPTGGAGPVFPTFDPGPSTVPTPTPTPKPTPSTQPTSPGSPGPSSTPVSTGPPNPG
jgi:membrane peptidoglycan carboxypeptidase